MRVVTHRRTLWAAIALGLAALAAIPFATAAAPLTYVTPAAMAKHIAGAVPQIPLGNSSVPSVISASTCTGTGAAHAGKFNTFKCKATWLSGQKTTVVWARARPGGQFCAAVTLAACPAAAPTVGDPRVCSNPPAPPTADPNKCAVGSAILAVTRAMGVKLQNPAIQLLNLTCTGQNLKWTCVFSTSASYTVFHATTSFVQSKTGAWTASIATSVGNCTVLPGAPKGGYRWRVGPTPVCT
jgi:hypothetical protein